MNIEELEKRLNELKKEIPEELEVWMDVEEYEGYKVSSKGRVFSYNKEYTRPSPFGKKMTTYKRKSIYLVPLHTGIDRKWTSIRLTTQQGKYKQFSLAKLLIASFLKIKLTDLPRNIYFIDLDGHNITLHNLTFIRKNKEKFDLYDF